MRQQIIRKWYLCAAAFIIIFIAILLAPYGQPQNMAMIPSAYFIAEVI